MAKIRPQQAKISIGAASNNTVTTEGYVNENVASKVKPINTQAGPAYTATSTDNGAVIRLGSGGLTLPEDSTEDLPVGFTCDITGFGSDEQRILPQGSDILLCDPPFNVLRARYSTATIVKKESGVWGANGDFKLFDMASLPGLVVWYDASDEDAITPNGSTAQDVLDKSGNGHDVTQISSILQADYNEMWNGRRVLSFDGSSKYYAGGVIPDLQIAGDLTICVAMNNFVPSSSNRNLGGTGISGETEATNGLWVFSYNSTSNFYNFWEYGAGNNVTVSSSIDLLATPSLAFSVRDTIAKEMEFIVNNTSDVVSYGTNPTGGSAGTYTLSTAFGSPWIGQLGEYAVFNQVLSSETLNEIKNHWSAKWGIPSFT